MTFLVLTIIHISFSFAALRVLYLGYSQTRMGFFSFILSRRRRV